MKTKIGVIIILVLITIFIGNIVKETIESNKKMSANVIGYEEDLSSNKSIIKKGDIAPAIELTNLKGEQVSLEDLKGKNVVLNFWATWCPPCKAEMPHLQDYYDQYKTKQNVEVVGVNLTFAKDSETKVKQFIESYNLDFPIYLTNNQKVENIYQIITIPSTFFIDTEGRIQRKIVGPLDTKSLQHYVGALNE